jgi:phosphoribosyl 1,2-cyclic phosphodiesterase
VFTGIRRPGEARSRPRREHPGPPAESSWVVGYRIEQNGKVISYCTDVEHGPEWSDRNVKTLAQDTDLFIVDSQYPLKNCPNMRVGT